MSSLKSSIISFSTFCSSCCSLSLKSSETRFLLFLSLNFWISLRNWSGFISFLKSIFFFTFSGILDTVADFLFFLTPRSVLGRFWFAAFVWWSRPWLISNFLAGDSRIILPGFAFIWILELSRRFSFKFLLASRLIFTKANWANNIFLSTWLLLDKTSSG